MPVDVAKGLILRTADILTAHLSRNSVPPGELPQLIGEVHSALSKVATPLAKAAEPLQPAVPIGKSVSPDFIVCLEDGKRLKMLKRHLMSAYGMTPDAYRARWGLPRDYPMVAPNYSVRRSALARKLGLGLQEPVVAETV
jgi:predicted transcriptional regulator